MGQPPMADYTADRLWSHLPPIPDDKPVLIAGPTASGKSALALMIAEHCGGVVVNADASQVYACWRVISARPSREEEARTPHLLYGHIAYDQTYSAGHWLREVTPLLRHKPRPIIVGGTGLYLSALTEGMAIIPATPPEIRAQADARSLEDLIDGIDVKTLRGLDIRNRARLQRAWEVQRATSRSLSEWQADTPPPILHPRDAVPIVLDAEKDWLLGRINRRFDQMLAHGAMEEVTAMRAVYDPGLPTFKAIGVPELMAYLEGRATLVEARERATTATRRFAKRQRTWFRTRMKSWHHVNAAP